MRIAKACNVTTVDLSSKLESDKALRARAAKATMTQLFKDKDWASLKAAVTISLPVMLEQASKNPKMAELFNKMCRHSIKDDPQAWYDALEDTDMFDSTMEVLQRDCEAKAKNRAILFRFVKMCIEFKFRLPCVSWWRQDISVVSVEIMDVTNGAIRAYLFKDPISDNDNLYTMRRNSDQTILTIVDNRVDRYIHPEFKVNKEALETFEVLSDGILGKELAAKCAKLLL